MPPEVAQVALLPYVQAKRAKGRWYVYFRIAGTYRRMRGVPGSAEWHEDYARLRGIAEKERPDRRCAAGTVAALVAEYRASPSCTRLAIRTQADYARALDILAAPLGRFPADAITRADVIRLRDKVAARSGPRAADLFATVVARCFQIGLDRGYVEINRFRSIERIAESESHRPWPAAVRAAFEASRPPAHLMTAYMIGLWTALRRETIVRLGRQHDDGRTITIAPSKTRRSSGVEVAVPVLAPLRRHLESLPADRLLYVTRADGRPVDKDALTHELADHMAAIGHPGYTLHGLRHTTGDALAEVGATTHQIQAVLGHTTLAQAERYTRRADRKRLAREGMAGLEARLAGTGTEPEDGKPSATNGKPEIARRR